MSHFAKVENDIVTEVIVAEQDFIDSGVVGDPLSWIQTSYNTRGGKYYSPETGLPDDISKALRKNYAGVGYTYDRSKDAFIPPQPFPSWILNIETCLWNAPSVKPNDGKPYEWNEPAKSWVLMTESE